MTHYILLFIALWCFSAAMHTGWSWTGFALVTLASVCFAMALGD